MPTRDELQSLLAKVEAATGPDQEIDYAITEALTPWLAARGYKRLADYAGWYSDTPLVEGGNRIAPAERYTASIDAIVGLIESKLPDSARESGNRFGPQASWYRAQITGGSYCVAATRPTEPLALCAAFLQALIASMPKEESR